jgi:hypothetical protein
MCTTNAMESESFVRCTLLECVSSVMLFHVMALMLRHG